VSSLLDADRDLAGDCPAELHPVAAITHEQADELPVRHERHGDSRAAAPARELRPQLGEPEGRPGVAGVGRTRPPLELFASGVEEVDVTCARREQRLRALDHGGDELVERVRAGDRLGELRELLQLRHAQARLLVEPRVLDRAPDEARRAYEEVDLVVRELARRLRVRGDCADRIARAAEDRERQQRLEPLLLELGHVLRARIGSRVVADERGLAVLGRPPGEALPALERDLSGLPLVGR
jgi:hypothetical protein